MTTGSSSRGPSLTPRPADPAGRAPHPGRGVAAAAALRGNLGDGLAMSAAAGSAAVVGLLSWIVAARSLSPSELGTAAAFVSGFLLVTGCTGLNLGFGLLRWLPAAGAATGRLLLRAAATVTTFAAAVAVIYLTVVPGASVIGDAITGPGATGVERVLAVGVFALAAGLYATFQLQDFMLVGLRRPWSAPARMAAFGAGRLGILLGAGAALTTTGVVVSWLVPTAACVALVGAQSWRVARRTSATASFEHLPSRSEVARFLGPAYAGQIATSLLFNQVPLLMVYRFGTAEGAAFFLVWQVVTVVDVLATYFSASLAAGVARQPARAAEISRAVRRWLLVIALPALAVGALVAEPILSLFGQVYAGEADVLRLMLAGMAMRLLVVHRIGEHQALGRGFRFARLAFVNTALVMGAALLVPATSTEPLATFGIGFVVVQAACAAAVTLRRRSEGRRSEGRRSEGRR